MPEDDAFPRIFEPRYLGCYGAQRFFKHPRREANRAAGLPRCSAARALTYARRIYSKENSQKSSFRGKKNNAASSDGYMKRILLLSAALLGAASAARAGVQFNFGIGLPLPPLPGIVIGRPAPVVVAPPVCSVPALVVVAPPSIYLGVGPGCHGYRYPCYRGHAWGRHDEWRHRHGAHRW